MDQEMIWVPCVQLCRNIQTEDFKLIEFGMKQGGGASYMVGPIHHFYRERFEREGLKIVLRSLKAYRIWPAGIKLDSEFGRLIGRELRVFIQDHLFVEILQREEDLLRFAPQHRMGDTWREIASEAIEEMPLVLPTTQKKFYKTLELSLKLCS